MIHDMGDTPDPLSPRRYLLVGDRVTTAHGPGRITNVGRGHVAVKLDTGQRIRAARQEMERIMPTRLPDPTLDNRGKPRQLHRMRTETYYAVEPPLGDAHRVAVVEVVGMGTTIVPYNRHGYRVTVPPDDADILRALVHALRNDRP